MTVTLSECTALELESTLLGTFLATPEDYTVQFNSNINCCSTSFSETIATEDVTVDTITITPTTYNRDAFISGVYYLEIVLIDENGTRQTDRICYFIDCENTIYSAVCAKLASDVKFVSNADRLYRALTYTSQCDDCDCNKACVLYEALLKELAIDFNKIKKDCGC